ncbi:polyprenyl synthetase family protein [Candidatus Curtissbacteria bacterium]|nr:polyprenyl synthetase family protein [Candidatus Curtissbacteria bacterium]
MLETAYGQGLDVEYANREPSFRQIMQIADLKAARYSVIGPLTIGATLAGVKRTQMAALNRYVAAVGLAFQLADDILGVFGEEKELGKSTLSDMREGKNTLLIYKTKQLAKGKDRRDIEKIWGKEDATVADLEEVKRIIEESGALAWCKAENRSLIEKAKKGIGKITSDESLQIIFSQLADFVISRRK